MSVKSSIYFRSWKEEFLDFNLTDEQQSFCDVAKQFTAKHFYPNANKWDAEEIFPIDTMREAAKLGFGGLFVAPEYGGCNLKRLDAAMLFETLAAGCVTTTAYLTIHNMVAGMLDRFGSVEQKKHWLPKLVTMEYFSSYCLTEPESGSDAASLKTTAVLDGNEYILNGSKCFISGGGVSDIYLCMVRTGAADAKGISAIVVKKGTAGLSFGKPEEKLGWRSQPTTTISFNNCRVPAKNLLGSEGQGFKFAMMGLDGGRINIAACSLGGAKAALDATIDYTQERKQFNKPISEFQNTQFRLADMATSLEAARLMTYRAASSLDHSELEATKNCAMAKLFTTDICSEIVDQALQLHGGYGYIKEYNIERYWRDLRVHRILEGTNEIMRLIIARKLLY